MTLPIVDVDDTSTWPPLVTETVAQWVERYGETTEYTNDLALRAEDEGWFRDLLEERLLRAYHCTRLLPHEAEMVQTQGLRPLSLELMRDRIDAAQAVGSISPEDAHQLRAANVFATGEQRNREAQVCLILSRLLFQRDLHGCLPLLTNWGGEATYKSSGANALPDRLTSMGIPTVVVALLDVGGQGSSHLFFPALHKVFVGAALGLVDVGADIFYKSLVPPHHIERILQPGDLVYESLGALPTEVGHVGEVRLHLA